MKEREIILPKEINISYYGKNMNTIGMILVFLCWSFVFIVGLNVEFDKKFIQFSSVWIFLSTMLFISLKISKKKFPKKIIITKDYIGEVSYGNIVKKIYYKDILSFDIIKYSQGKIFKINGKNEGIEYRDFYFYNKELMDIYLPYIKKNFYCPKLAMDVDEPKYLQTEEKTKKIITYIILSIIAFVVIFGIVVIILHGKT